MKVAIIDDEEDARATLSALLRDCVPSWEIAGTADGIAAGKKLIETTRPDIVFLDVMMKDGTGFDLLKELPETNFELVFVSGHDEYALKAFRFSAIDYLLKPVVRQELAETCDRIRSRRGASDTPTKVAALSANSDRNLMNNRLVLKDADTIFVVDIDQIIRCESSNNYTTFYLLDHPPILVSRTLKEFEELLQDREFVRVHQSHLINLKYLVQLNKKDGDMAILKNGSQVPVSLRKKDALLARLYK